ncbi:uncharacterized protein LOC121731905 [Aricia agestis]|uniref:uncharacterized protein LOC121731905 n=1 Tax=Aricia agestis TaxID=91739 RepID=UPI001C20B934|nr:uncharacterized protein LOC121731905 [Aricia agestis]
MHRLLLILLIAAGVGAAPFFDALYDAIAGNGRRSYGYGYNGYDNGYRYDGGYRPDTGYRAEGYRPRQGKTWKDLCRVHYPDSAFGVPGSAGVVCPY